MTSRRAFLLFQFDIKRRGAGLVLRRGNGGAKPDAGAGKKPERRAVAGNAWPVEFGGGRERHHPVAVFQRHRKTQQRQQPGPQRRGMLAGVRRCGRVRCVGRAGAAPSRRVRGPRGIAWREG